MKNTFSSNQAQSTHESCPTKPNEFDGHINALSKDGLGLKVANDQINNVVIEYEKRMFYNRMEKEKKEYIQLLLATTITIIACFGPILNLSGLIWYVTSALSTLILGYHAFNNKIAGAICGLSMNCILYFVIDFCLSHTASLLYILIVLPIFFTLIPTFLLYRLLTQIIPDKHS